MSAAEYSLPFILCAGLAGLLCVQIYSGVAGARDGVIRRAVCAEGFWIALAAQALVIALFMGLTMPS